ncbi:Transcriptional regulatory protein DegU [Emticicia aquatica]|uniref:Transcriptional regulatory protein DegU n=1 Tax=Emticicia aquatica TaxID=1681835 RepID=A0ABM9ALV9_9BACT|nr:response regulator transcription factor [Emticicia aquatica]CAH0994530.1 Transcriptional regulatory protein DegU [Emticicia aquatica]
MIEIFLVEDHPLVTEGIKAIFERQKDLNCSNYFDNGKDLLTKLNYIQPDVIVLDINLPDINGIDLCKMIKEKFSNIHVIALSINNEKGIIKKMLENGASGYILKDAAQYEIVDAIRTVVQRKNYFSLSASTTLKKPDEKVLPSLTRREKEILVKIADGLTNQQIADLLFVDVSTVSSHRKNMLAKYDVQNTAQLIKLAITEKLI